MITEGYYGKDIDDGNVDAALAYEREEFVLDMGEQVCKSKSGQRQRPSFMASARNQTT